MSESSTEYVSAEELFGGVRAAESPAEDFRPPLDCLIAMRPFGHKTIKITGRDTDAVDVYCIIVNEDGSWTNVLRAPPEFRFDKDLKRAAAAMVLRDPGRDGDGRRTNPK